MTKQVIRQNITTWPELGINYWGINKNATSTFINHFSFLCGVINYEQLYISGGQYGKKKINRDRYISSTTAFSNGLINFAIVRDPYYRFESCYKHFKYPLSYQQERGSRKAKFESTWSANDFLQHIHKKLCKGEKSGNKHFWRQTTFINSADYMDIIIKLEHYKTQWPFSFAPPAFNVNCSQKTEKIEYQRSLVNKIYKSDFKTFNYLYRDN